jgi:hypothetical protein
MYTLARLVRLAATVVVAFILAGIAIHLLDANTSNDIVSAVNDVAEWLTQPFHNFFDLNDDEARIAVNWGLAALVYAVAAAIIVRLLAGAGAGVGRFRRRSVG